MAREYVSSPVLQPAIQMRIGWSGGRPAISSGTIVSASLSKTLGSRKKLVTLISKSRGEQVQLVRIAAQHVQIAIHIIAVDRRHPHPPLDPAAQRALLVKCEIMVGLHTQKLDNLGQPVLRGSTGRTPSGLCIKAIRRPYLPIASGMLSIGRTRSTAPVMIALRGMPSKPASSGS